MATASQEEASISGQGFASWFGSAVVLLTCLVIAWLPLNVNRRLSDMGVETPDLQQEVSVFLFDLPAFLLTLLVIIGTGKKVLTARPTLVPGLLGGALALLTLSAVLEPSPRGAQTVLRVVVAVVLAHTVKQTRPGFDIQMIAGAYVVVASLEAALGLSQVVREQTLGLSALGEHPPLILFGQSISAKGTFVHHYIFGASLLLAVGVAVALSIYTRRRLWLAPLPLLGAAFGFTYSRSGAIAIILATALLLVHSVIRRGPQLAVAAVALILGCSVSVFASPDGWLERVRQTAGEQPAQPGVSRVDSVSTERVLLMKQAWKMIEQQPLTGVGTGLYSFALADQLDEPLNTPVELKPVHNVPLLIAAESGALLGLASLLFLAWLAYAALRAGAAAQVLYALYLPFLMLDHFPYDAPMGLAATGLWVGALLWLREHPADRDAPDPTLRMG